MNRKSVPFCLTVSLLAAVRLVSAQEQSWAGEYVDKKFLGEKAVFEMTIEQFGNAIQVSFDAAYSNGHGAAPEGHGPAKMRAKDTLEFTFEDSFNNSETGTITRAGDDIIVSMRMTRVADPGCLVFYGKNIPLKRIGKK